MDTQTDIPAPTHHQDQVIASLTTEHLAPADTEALCRYLALPTPTPDVPLAALLAESGRTLADVWRSLEGTRDVRLMIAAAALRGGVVRLPPDPQLRPAPHRRAPVKAPRTEAERARGGAPKAPPSAPTTVPPDHVLVAIVPNPKKPGSASRDRYARYALGQTQRDAIVAGLTREDLRWDTERGFLTWAPPGSAPAVASPTEAS